MPKIAPILDEKDRKILAALDDNARSSDSAIAKHVGVSKQVANYRIQKLCEKGIISNFYTILNAGKLGLYSYYVFLQFEKINKEQEKNLLNQIKNLEYVGWLVSGMGRWDAVALIFADSISNFDRFLNEIISLCGEHMHEYNFTTLVSAEHISYKFLAGKKDVNNVKQTEKDLPLELDKNDIAILEVLSQQARFSVVDIAKKAKLPIHVVTYRLKNMVKKRLIEGFKPKININKLGYQWHLLLLQFQKADEQQRKRFITFCENHQKIYYIAHTIGCYNFMLDIHVKDTEEFKDVLLELKEKFSDIIKIYESLIVFDEYKISYFPKELLEVKINKKKGNDY